MVMDSMAYQNGSVHAQTFQLHFVVRSNEAVAMLLSLLLCLRKRKFLMSSNFNKQDSVYSPVVGAILR
jgi:hypothetical protein